MVDGSLDSRSMSKVPDLIFDEYESEVDDGERAMFERVTDKYRLVSKIGEGTFSTVYKAEDVLQHMYDDRWVEQRGGSRDASYYVAIKRIYVTSSPQRIYNELDILRSLSCSDNVLPMITAFRHEDQVFIVLPYFKHPDFRNYYKELSLLDIRYYMRSLFLALEDVHAVGVLHRDVKPTNFLYDVRGRKGELVDFGLAERQQAVGHCPCQRRSGQTAEQMCVMVNPTHLRLSRVYLKDEQRPGKRANRAGTRGFRAPEVLFKCDSQYSAVDIWSAGVILLTFLSTRFPFFNSNDDVDALIEIASIFGKANMRTVAAQHNCSFETNVPTLHERAISFTRLVHWSTNPDRRSDDNADSAEQEMALSFLERCLTLDPWIRWSASDALQDPFLSEIEADELGATLLQEENAAESDTEYEMGGLESAADIESPAVTHPQLVTQEQRTEADTAYVDSTSEARQTEQGRPKEFVFLKTDDYPDETLHDQMRQQLISNVNNMRAKREASFQKPEMSSHLHPLRPHHNRRSKSTSEVMFAQQLTRPVTPLNQILPESPTSQDGQQNRSASQLNRIRARTASPGKTNLTEVPFRTIDPRALTTTGE